MACNHFLIHRALSSNVILLRSPTFEMNISNAVLTEAEFGSQIHSLPTSIPQGPLRPLGGPHWTPWSSWEALLCTSPSFKEMRKREPMMTRSSSIWHQLTSLPHGSLYFIYCGLSSVFRICHSFFSGPFQVLFSLLEALSVPLHASLSPHPQFLSADSSIFYGS